MAEKNQKPTPKRLRDARKRGEVVFSADVASTAVFTGVVVSLWLLGTMGFNLLHQLWLQTTNPAVLRRPEEHYLYFLVHGSEVLLWGCLPITLVAALAAVAGSFFQVGGVAAWSLLKPDLNRMNPVEGFKRIFSTRNLINLLKTLLKLALLTALVVFAIRAFTGTAAKLGYAQPPVILTAVSTAVLTVFAWSVLVYLLAAAVDYAHQYYEFMKQQRMSVEELRREYKEVEGDPVNQARRRSAHFEAVYASLGDRVRTASAVIHSARIAVALQYLGEKDLPRVIARGENEVAAQIRRFAGEALIPMEFEPGLAERVYQEVPLNQPVPRSLYAPIAKLLRWAQGVQ
jgi:type III secretion protein U